MAYQKHFWCRILFFSDTSHTLSAPCMMDAIVIFLVLFFFCFFLWFVQAFLSILQCVLHGGHELYYLYWLSYTESGVGGWQGVPLKKQFAPQLKTFVPPPLKFCPKSIKN